MEDMKNTIQLYAKPPTIPSIAAEAVAIVSDGNLELVCHRDHETYLLTE